MDIHNLKPGTLINNTYRIQKHIGSGSFGEVYSASHTKKEGIFALKFLKPMDNDEKMNEAFQRLMEEATLGKSLRDIPNCAPPFEVGMANRTFIFVVCNYVPGETLEKVLSRQKSLRPTPREIKDLMISLLSTLGKVHEAGMIHRDIKPENIIISNKGVPVLIDFGLLKSANEDVRRTKDGQVAGTPQYMAPTQVCADRPTHLWDLYAVGLIFYELVTGKMPFEATDLETAGKIAMAHVQGKAIEFIRNETEEHRLSSAPFTAVIEKLLLADQLDSRFDEELGYSSAEEAIRDLNAIEVKSDSLQKILVSHDEVTSAGINISDFEEIQRDKKISETHDSVPLDIFTALPTQALEYPEEESDAETIPPQSGTGIRKIMMIVMILISALVVSSIILVFMDEDNTTSLPDSDVGRNVETMSDTSETQVEKVEGDVVDDEDVASKGDVKTEKADDPPAEAIDDKPVPHHRKPSPPRKDAKRSDDIEKHPPEAEKPKVEKKSKPTSEKKPKLHVPKLNQKEDNKHKLHVPKLNQKKKKEHRLHIPEVN